jgi:hypothetical protein
LVEVTEWQPRVEERHHSCAERWQIEKKQRWMQTLVVRLLVLKMIHSGIALGPVEGWLAEPVEASWP